jgi:S1-C subfamily serine protease
MRRTIAVVVLLIFSVGAHAQKMLTGKEIYRINCKSIVQIKTHDGFGVGFITSADGVIMTANHVVTTRESHFRQYATDIKVFVDGKALPYPATPTTDRISDSQVNYDSAVLKIEAFGLPHVTLGNWTDMDIGDTITMIPTFPGIGCILLEGIIAVKKPIKTDLGPEPVNTILFQLPVRNGFSGSPIFNSKGYVVGIEDTKVFGISPALAELRNKWMASGQAVTVRIGGADISGTVLELVNNLDQNLISGLGSGVDIGYAKQQLQENNKK